MNSDQSDFWRVMSDLMALQRKVSPVENTPLVDACDNNPLSYSQQRVFVTNMLGLKSARHNLPFLFKVEGDLDVDLLHRSLNRIINRHEIFRTTYSEVDGNTFQSAGSGDQIEIEILEHKGNEPSGHYQTEPTKEFIEREFDLTQDYPIRAGLEKLGDKHYLLVFVIHHIAFDGWSENIFIQELSSFYNEVSENSHNSHDAPVVNYATYSIWQLEQTDSELYSLLKDFWRQQFKNGIHTPKLPQVTSANSSGCGLTTRRLTESLTNRLKDAAKSRRTTLYVLTLTAFKLLTLQYTQQQQVAICTPVANRNQKPTQNIIGYFVNLIIIQSKLEKDHDFEKYLNHVKQQCAGAIAHQDLPLDIALSTIDHMPERVTRALFAMQNTPSTDLDLNNTAVQRIKVPSPEADFDLFMSIFDTDKQLEIELQFDASRFDTQFAENLSCRFEILLEKICDGETELKALQVIPLEEQRTYLSAQEASKKNKHELEDPNQNKALDSDTEKKLANIWRDYLGCAVGRDDNYFDLGGQSITAVQMMDEVKKTFKKTFSISVLIERPTLAELAELIERGESQSKSQIVVEIKKSNSENKKLWGVHGVGGTVMSYKYIADYLDDSISVYGLQSKGLNGDIEPLDRVEDMAKLYIEEMLKVQPEGPYLICGYSFGGIIAAEIAVQLAELGKHVSFLGMLDAPSPDVANSKPTIFKFVSAHAINFFKEENEKKLAYLSSRLKWFRERKHANKTEYERNLNDKHPKLRMYNVLKPNYAAAQKYKAKPIAVKITIFRAHIQLARCFWHGQMGWEKYCANIEVLNVPGGHLSMVEEPHVSSLGASLNSSLKSIASST